jgi:hypothetical protein
MLHPRDRNLSRGRRFEVVEIGMLLRVGRLLKVERLLRVGRWPLADSDLE